MDIDCKLLAHGIVLSAIAKQSNYSYVQVSILCANTIQMDSVRESTSIVYKQYSTGHQYRASVSFVYPGAAVSAEQEM